jgi:hypothetical protein
MVTQVTRRFDLTLLSHMWTHQSVCPLNCTRICDSARRRWTP